MNVPFRVPTRICSAIDSSSASAESLHYQDRRRRVHSIRKRAAIGDPLVTDEDVDVSAEPAPLVAYVEREPRSDLVDLANDLGDSGCLHHELAPIELGKEREEVL